MSSSPAVRFRRKEVRVIQVLVALVLLTRTTLTQGTGGALSACAEAQKYTQAILRPIPRLSRPRKIYDCFLFNDETDMLEIRIQELRDVVDLFVIVETRRTFTGKLKRLVFQDVSEKYAPFVNQIKHVIVDDFPENKDNDPWKTERYLRDALFLKGLPHSKLRDGDILVVSDVDEIIRPEILRALKYCEGFNGTKVQFVTTLFYYSFSNKINSLKWGHPDATMYHSNESLVSAEVLRTPSESSTIFSDAGWHCSYCFRSLSSFRNKLGSFSHTEYGNNQKYYNKSHIINVVRNGLDIFERDYVRSTFIEALDVPSFVLANMDRYAFILDRRGPTAGFADFYE